MDDVKKEARQLFHAVQGRDAATLRRYDSIDCLAGCLMQRYEDLFLRRHRLEMAAMGS